MKKVQVMLMGMAVSGMLLAGCGDTSEPVSGSEVTESTVTEETVVTDTDTDTQTDDSVPPQPGMVRSRLTNEWVTEEIANQRAIAVMIANQSSAIPHYGLSQASVLYECNVEGRMTRMMAIFEDYTDIEKLGNVRSLRDYYAYWAFEWDAVICHFGGPYYIDEVMAKSTTDHMDGNLLTTMYFRSSDRPRPHNAYIDGTEVLDAMESQGISTKNDRDLADETHYQFTTPSSPNTLEQYASSEEATYIDMTGCYPLTRCYFEYNESDGLYYRSQHISGGTDGPHIDGANGEQLTFKNVIIQSCEYAVRDGNGYLWFETTDSGRDAWFFTEGRMIKCTWEKESAYGATRYYDEDGNEITLNTGKTMVLIIEEDDMFDYE